jgi:hypothetical protein
MHANETENSPQRHRGFESFVEKSYSVVSVCLWCKFGLHSRQFVSIRGWFVRLGAHSRLIKVVSTDRLQVVKLLVWMECAKLRL